jgi:cell division protein FtsQ
LFLVGVAAASWMLHEPVWAALRTHPYFAVTDITVRGTGPLLADEEIFDWLGVTESLRIWDVPSARIRARLEMHPLVARAHVQRAFPNRLVIQVREHQPQALLLLDGLHYVGRHGRVLRRLEPWHNADFTIITGLGSRSPSGYRIWAVRRALRLQRLCERIACFEGVSGIHVDPERGMIVYPREPRVPVIVGWGSWREKLVRAERVLDVWKNRTHHLRRVDLRFRNQVVVELRDPGVKRGTGKRREAKQLRQA